MKELRKILKRADELITLGESGVLATVVRVRGSAYRRPGARMLFSNKGREAGFVSAACLEADLFEKAKEVIASQKPSLISYDTTAPEDAIFGIGQGCAGFIDLLIEPIQTQQSPLLRIMQLACEQHEPCAIATVYQSSGPERETIGSKFLCTFNGTPTSFLDQAELQREILFDAEEALRNGTSLTKQYSYSENTADVFIDIIRKPLQLVIFGATPDVKPLVRLTVDLGWSVIVVDHRSAYAIKSDFPEADAVNLLSPDEYISSLQFAPETFAVIMIHQFLAEARALQFLLSSGIRYIGLLGPKSKCEMLLRHLAAEGFSPTVEQLAVLHSPVGLDIGAETAEEIAVAIVGEIQAIHQKRVGGFLKNRQGSIH